MRRITRLNENDLSRIVRRVIRENSDPLQSLIGKTAVFKPTDIDNIEVRSENYKDTWFADELNRESMSENDRYHWEKFKTKSVKGTITQIRTIRRSSVILFAMKIIDGPSYEPEIFNISYECDSEKFTFTFDKLTGGFFDGKKINVEYTNNQMSEFLDKNLPCGGFDLSKSGSIDGDELGNTLS